MGRLAAKTHYNNKQTTPPPSSSSKGGSVLWTWMLFGLLACLVNIFYEAGAILGGLHLSRFDPVHGELILNDGGASSSSMSLSISSLSHRTPPKHIPLPPQQPQQPKAAAAKQELQVEEVGTPVDWNNLDPELVRDKGRLIDLIRDAEIEDVTVETLQQLPSWSEVTYLYGTEPIILGMPEQCEAFQNAGEKHMHFLSTAGTFNSGTNLMAELLIHNCHLPDHERVFKGQGIRWQPIWGKHTPVNNETYRLTHRAYKDPNYQAKNIFPAVMVRDPYKWMQSMCRHRYESVWQRDLRDREHCPNLVIKNYLGGLRPNKVGVKYADFKRTYNTLVELWNEFYSEYLNATFPFVMIRMEDLVYYPKEITEKVCICGGGKMRRKFMYITDSAKKGKTAHGDVALRTSYVQALIRYGKSDGRYSGFHAEDLEYTKQHLDPQLMKLFGYRYQEDSEVG